METKLRQRLIFWRMLQVSRSPSATLKAERPKHNQIDSPTIEAGFLTFLRIACFDDGINLSILKDLSHLAVNHVVGIFSPW